MLKLSGARVSPRASEKWGFSDNVLPDAVVLSVTITHDGSVVASAVEEGSFTTYNRTIDPVTIEAELAFQGTEAFLQSTLDSLKTLQSAPTTFSIKTPTAEYQSFALESFDYALRREDGLGVLYINGRFVEVKEVSLEYTKNDVILPESTKAPSAASTTNRGNVQTETVQKESALNAMGGSKVVEKIKNIVGGLFA